ncbi:hypothetical protein [Chlamydia felis Fe/C-56]|uniref:Uncharacterized protein n=1 Tax=Chlamydia felis (strain Fe/C-56) TaxID=264202 RepID=Q253U7_CHLFF|nr:hypothetical protein [Chlamydia felis]BAE81441.1 hypothetical protein [Chlamydia felis Fe/C-56]
MGIIQIPRHTHVNKDGSVCEAAASMFPEAIHGCPMAPESMMNRLQHIPLVLIPLIGLIYAGVFYYRYTKALTALKEINDFTPNTKCPPCRETAYAMWSPIVISLCGGLGLLLPLLILLIPILLIIGLAKAVIGMGQGIIKGAKHCLGK